MFVPVFVRCYPPSGSVKSADKKDNKQTKENNTSTRRRRCGKVWLSLYPLNSNVARVTCFQPNALPVIGLLCNHIQSKAELETKNSNLKLPTAVGHLRLIAGRPSGLTIATIQILFFFVNASSWANAACTKLSIEHNIMMIRYLQVDQPARRPFEPSI